MRYTGMFLFMLITCICCGDNTAPLIRHDLFDIPPHWLIQREVKKSSYSIRDIHQYKDGNRAILFHVDTKEIYYVKVNDRVENWTVKDINPDYVLLMQGKETLTLRWNKNENR